ncbi:MULTISPECIES: acyl carrier protein [unclassified Paenibacillus]|uniref:acyl carrier protein n=1 Tax=unclassified Paenibacillus TaxID=185978 RepID=UPI0030F64513
MIREQNDETMLKIKTVISPFTDVDIQEIQMESKLICDLGFTSFDLVCLLSVLEEEFGLKVDEKMLKGIQTVEDVRNAVLKHQASSQTVLKTE